MATRRRDSNQRIKLGDGEGRDLCCSSLEIYDPSCATIAELKTCSALVEALPYGFADTCSIEEGEYEYCGESGCFTLMYASPSGDYFLFLPFARYVSGPNTNKLYFSGFPVFSYESGSSDCGDGGTNWGGASIGTPDYEDFLCNEVGFDFSCYLSGQEMQVTILHP